MKKIARVFPRITKATPRDELCFFDGPGLFPPDVDEVHISVAFTWDLKKAEWLEKQWRHIAPVKIGGPALGKPSGEFVPGMYVKPGYVITSRGCPNRCWFCSVWRREQILKELFINSGNNILDDNLLACSDSHISKVFDMLEEQKNIQFTGGLEAKILKIWHIERMLRIKIKQMFFAYDTKDDFEPLINAAEMLKKHGYTRHQLRCYVLIGYPNDTILNAIKRLEQVLSLGMFPMAMLWKNEKGMSSYEWRKLQRKWARPAIISKYQKTGA